MIAMTAMPKIRSGSGIGNCDHLIKAIIAQIMTQKIAILNNSPTMPLGNTNEAKINAVMSVSCLQQSIADRPRVSERRRIT
jgi:hypothetical protein